MAQQPQGSKTVSQATLRVTATTVQAVAQPQPAAIERIPCRPGQFKVTMVDRNGQKMQPVAEELDPIAHQIQLDADLALQLAGAMVDEMFQHPQNPDPADFDVENPALLGFRRDEAINAGAARAHYPPVCPQPEWTRNILSKPPMEAEFEASGCRDTLRNLLGEKLKACNWSQSLRERGDEFIRANNPSTLTLEKPYGQFRMAMRKDISAEIIEDMLDEMRNVLAAQTDKMEY
ncbi:hypothetical protein L596_001297 [Steinernema carpocapsae]|uniref:Uncharacterized protein n=1 Tax=Steinernema carpocapsae TaxID=34508 RepID=A0A4V6YST6_STECR|nr:hypothetical protein L596_001297 [Steinernema carpocapsae]